MMPDLVTVEDVAARLQVDSCSVLRLVEAGQLAAMNIDGKPRIFAVGVDDFLAAAYGSALDEAERRRTALA